jgi:Resolvase, N terminal domain
LLGTIQDLEACGVDLYLDQQSIDTTTPAGKLMFQVTGAFAEFERSIIRQHAEQCQDRIPHWIGIIVPGTPPGSAFAVSRDRDLVIGHGRRPLKEPS